MIHRAPVTSIGAPTAEGITMEVLAFIGVWFFILCVWILLVWALTPAARWLIDRLTR